MSQTAPLQKIRQIRCHKDAGTKMHNFLVGYTYSLLYDIYSARKGLQKTTFFSGIFNTKIYTNKHDY